MLTNKVKAYNIDHPDCSSQLKLDHRYKNIGAAEITTATVKFVAEKKHLEMRYQHD